MSKKILTGVVAGTLMVSGVVGGFARSADAAMNYLPIDENFKDIPVFFSKIQPSQNAIVFDYNGTGVFQGQNARIINIMWEDVADAGRLAEFGELRDQQPEWAHQLVYLDLPSWSSIGAVLGHNWQFMSTSEMQSKISDNKLMKFYYSVGAWVDGEMVYYSGVIDYTTCARADGTIDEGVECVAVRQGDGTLRYEPYYGGMITDWAATEGGKYDPEVVYAEEIAAGKAAREAERIAQEEAQKAQELREEVERIAREEAERVAKEEAERVAKEEAERVAQEEAERIAREEAERVAQEEAERVAREEAEKIAYEEAERVAREEAERIAAEEAERRAQEEVVREEEERLAREEAERVLWEQIETLLADEEAKLREEMEAEHVAMTESMNAERDAVIQAAYNERIAAIEALRTEMTEKMKSEFETVNKMIASIKLGVANSGGGEEGNRTIVVNVSDDKANSEVADSGRTTTPEVTNDAQGDSGKNDSNMDLPQLGEEEADMGWLVICGSVVVAFGAGLGFYWLVLRKRGEKK